ncbi:PhzF family phenazine biosynthesis protein [Bacillus sp. BRMEA1]|uniref:PhzF family phenazine biosynthesis protein n=1 Tax=Neobacillus endophyticus TaxID=2738405 RepID=UPI001567B8AF|nr:PhzF family phenazine biosynthesis protein [Neobacillus endophyticus]NRD80122.1 PhzF family phenazine biosynthesis protein [Neobacillus endophyticus]
MKSIKVYQYDAFSKEPNKGNPAGVLLNADDLTDEEMQEIAFKVGFNETAFPVKSEVADIRLRYFTPGHEMNLCGHGTMATVYALKTRGLLGESSEITIETLAGILPIKIQANADHDIHISMKQARPQFIEYNGSKKELAYSIGLAMEDLDNELPIMYGSTGIWTLLVPIKKLSAFKKMKVNNQLFPDILREMPRASIHPFCLETYDTNAVMHARHFSSPFSGTIEDPVTGTASGVMGAYYAKYINTNFSNSLNLIVEQGLEIGKDGKVIVKVTKCDNDFDIEITGNAVYVKEFEVLL